MNTKAIPHEASTEYEVRKTDKQPIGSFTVKRVIHENEPLFEGEGTIGECIDRFLKNNPRDGSVMSVTVRFKSRR